MPPFPEAAFVAGQRAVGAVPGRPVVGTEKDERAALQVQPLERLNHPPDALVHYLDHLLVRPRDLSPFGFLTFLAAGQTLRRIIPALVRIMRRLVRQIQTEGFVLMPLDEVNPMPGDQVGAVACFGSLLMIFPPVVVARLVDMRVVIHVAADVADELVKALPDGIEFRTVTHMPLAENPRHIAALFEHLGECHFLQRHSRMAMFGGGHDALDTASLLVASRQQRRPRRAAHRSVGMVVRKPHAAPGKGVDVRRLDYFAAVTADVPVPQIIGHNQNEIRPIRSLRPAPQSAH